MAVRIVRLGTERAPGEGYYDAFRADYAERRSAILDALSVYEVMPPEGTYFVMARVPEDDSDAFARRLIEERYNIGAYMDNVVAALEYTAAAGGRGAQAPESTSSKSASH